MRRGAANILLFAAVVALALSLATLVSGGFAWRGVPFSSRDPWRPLLAAIVLLAVARTAAGGGFREAASRYTGTRAQVPARVAALAAASLLLFSLAWSSRAAGGSDSSCYVLQAEAFARGHATLANPVAAVLPGMPNAVFAPTGFIPSRDYGRAVPICAPGLSLAMAAAYRVHPWAVFLVVPCSAALLVWSTFLFGRRIDDDVTGACAAVLVAASPIVLYQAVQPMSDVAAAAAWMAALASASPLAAGIWAGVAIVTRPNLALLVLALLVFRLKAEATGKETARQETGRKTPVVSAFRRNLPFALAIVPGLVLLLALNAARYGSPLATGYGSTDVLFTWGHVYANLLRYPRWVLETHTPFVLLGLAAPWVLRRDRERLRLALASLAAAALLVPTYLAYTVFDDWWYVRFLLPALPIAIALAVVVLRVLAARLPSVGGPVTVAAVTIALALFYVRVARERHAMELQALESRFRLAGEYAGRALPADAVFLAVQESGSIRFHGRRDTIAWDAIPEDGLDATLATLRARGRAPYIALEDAEEQRFRMRFDSQRAGALDWRPAAEVRSAVRVRFFAASDGAK